MKKAIYYGILSFILIMLHTTATAAMTATTPLLACNYCNTQTDFNNFAMNARSTDANGTYEYIVVNRNTGAMYDITVFKYLQANAKSVISSTLAAQDVVDAYNFWNPYFLPLSSSTKAKFVLNAPSGGGDGMAGFLLSVQSAICYAFTGTPDYVAMHNEMNSGGLGNIMKNALTQLLGYGPSAVFVFSNGDVATYNIYPDDPGSTACAYVKGSARDTNGSFINDRGLGGTGNSNGSNYVIPIGGGNYDIYITNQIWTCSYIQHEDGSRTLIGCVKTP